MKKLLLLSVALFGATAVSAADVTNPFYVPGEGKFLSETSATFQKTKFFADDYRKTATVAETLSYGIVKNASVAVTVADTFYFKKDFADWMTGDTSRAKNPAFGISGKYNIMDDDVKVQVEAGYTQGMTKDPYISNYTNSFALGGLHHQKNIFGTVKVGYDLGNGFLPYASFTADKIVGTYHKYHKDPVYTTRVALNKTFNENFTGDAGISYIWDKTKYALDKHENAWIADASVNYLFNETMSVGLKTEYLLRHRPNIPGVNYRAYTIGANLKVAF